MESATEVNADHERIVLEHEGVLGQIEEILRNHAPTKDMSMMKALCKIASDVRSIPVRVAEDVVAKFEEKHAEMLASLPNCTCQKCLKKAGLEEISPGATQVVEFVSLIKDIIQTAEKGGLDNFRGYSVCALFYEGEGDNKHGHSTSRISAITKADLEEVAGMDGINFFIEMLKHTDLDEEDIGTILDAAIIKAKNGGKYKRFKLQDELMKTVSGGGPGRGGLGGLLRTLGGRGGPGGPGMGVLELDGSQGIEGLKKQLGEKLEAMGMNEGPPEGKSDDEPPVM
jgi:hypothetical protein